MSSLPTAGGSAAVDFYHHVGAFSAVSLQPAGTVGQTTGQCDGTAPL